jgi:hypothetical protein
VSRALGVTKVANGKPGDHPINDICDHDIPVFSLAIDALIRDIHAFLPRYRMWDLFDWNNPPPSPEFETQLKVKLKELRDEAKDRGWEDKPR